MGREGPAAVIAAGQTRQPSDGVRPVVYRLDFSEYRGGSVEEWLESKGFKLRDAAKNPGELGLSIVNGALQLEAKTQLRGFIYNDSLHIEQFSTARLEWGVTKFPEGASYEKHVRNEALMVYFSFGEEKISSGSILLPNLPYFIGLFLCKADKLNMPYLGAYYHKGGRFVCVGHPQPNETVVSEFDLRVPLQPIMKKATFLLSRASTLVWTRRRRVMEVKPRPSSRKSKFSNRYQQPFFRCPHLPSRSRRLWLCGYGPRPQERPFAAASYVAERPTLLAVRTSPSRR